MKPKVHGLKYIMECPRALYLDHLYNIYLNDLFLDGTESEQCNCSVGNTLYICDTSC